MKICSIFFVLTLYSNDRFCFNKIYSGTDELDEFDSNSIKLSTSVSSIENANTEVTNGMTNGNGTVANGRSSNESIVSNEHKPLASNSLKSNKSLDSLAGTTCAYDSFMTAKCFTS